MGHFRAVLLPPPLGAGADKYLADHASRGLHIPSATIEKNEKQLFGDLICAEEARSRVRALLANHSEYDSLSYHHAPLLERKFNLRLLTTRQQSDHWFIGSQIRYE